MSQTSEPLTPGTPINLTLTDANTEYTATIPVGTKRIRFQARTSAVVRYAFVTGKVATPTAPYMTLKADGVYDSAEKLSWGGTLYFGTPTATTVVEIETWAAPT